MHGCCIHHAYHKVVPLYITCTHVAIYLSVFACNKVSKSNVYAMYMHHPLYITRQAPGSLSSLHSNLHSNKNSKESIRPAAVKSVACISRRMVNGVCILSVWDMQLTLD